MDSRALGLWALRLLRTGNTVRDINAAWLFIYNTMLPQFLGNWYVQSNRIHIISRFVAAKS